MTNLHRKTLITHIKSDVVVIIPQLCFTSLDDCDDLPPPPLPPPSPSENHSLPPLIILMFCTLAVTLSLIFYIAIMKTYRSFRNNRRRHVSRDEIHEDFIDEDRIHHPIWLINTIGLDQSVIDSIKVFNYKKGDGLIEGTDCLICLGEFVDDETLRILPKCSHAFHVPCINTWLLSHKNCPLCRAPIIKETSNNAQIDSNSIGSSTHEEIPNGVFENETNQVEIDRNDEISDKKSLFVDGTSSGVRVESDLAPMRRSVSLDSFSASMVHFAVSSIGVLDQESRLGSRTLFMSKKRKSIKRRGSCSSISIYSRVTKSSSFRRFSPKASSFQNRSY